MDSFLIELGYAIRKIRKIRGYTLQELAEKINKSKSTVSKYENGEISIDILTIYDIAKSLRITVEELLPNTKKSQDETAMEFANIKPSFFKNDSQIYAYYYDGRNKKIVTSLIKTTKYSPKGYGEIYMYMNIEDLEFPQACEIVYYGKIYHYEVLTNIYLENRDTPIEKATITILSPFQSSDERYGLWSGISIRPIMPASLKMLFTKAPQAVDKNLKEKLILSKEDYINMKHFNMFSIY